MSVVSASTAAAEGTASSGAAVCWSVMGPPVVSAHPVSTPDGLEVPTCDDGRMPGCHREQSAAAPPGYFAWEASGLRWLAEARDAGGAAVVDVLAEGPSYLDLALLA